MTTVLRGLREGDGAKLAVTWRELWDLHEAWGGYATDRDPLAFDRVAQRLDRDGAERRGEIAFGRHLHVVVEHQGEVVGQVEGWLDRLGVHPKTKTMCEVRSLVVRGDARHLGLARRLLERLSLEANLVAHEACVLVAEVLEANPAMTFYEKLGFRSVAWTRRLAKEGFHRAELELARPPHLLVRRSRAGDESAIARLESRLAERRKRAEDARFDPPHVVEAAWLGHLRGVLEADDPLAPQAFVTATRLGEVLAMAQYASQELEPPFFPQTRAIASRVEAFDQKDAYLALQLLARGLFRLARRANASAMEFVDLPPPTSPLSAALGAMGIAPWSRIMQRT